MTNSLDRVFREVSAPKTLRSDRAISTAPHYSQPVQTGPIAMAPSGKLPPPRATNTNENNSDFARILRHPTDTLLSQI